MHTLHKRLTLFFLFLTALLRGQGIAWSDISTTFSLPPGIKLFTGSRSSPALKIWYLEVDLKKQFVIKPYTTPLTREGILAFAARYQAVAAVNGGYFDPSTGAMLSTVVQPDNVLAKNVTSVVRSGKTYFLTRSFWGIKDDRSMAIDWIYHFGNRTVDIYRFTAPSPNTNGTPAPSPQPSAGSPYYELLAGVGGGPTLIKNGTVNITYDEEVFFDSGVALSSAQPRTAIGITADNKCILLVADGRQTASDGLTLTELASIMLSIGCMQAMNLDGGGSTQMAVNQTVVNLPEGVGAQRLLPCILAVVPKDSLPVLPPTYFNKKIDTGDPGCSLAGNGWTVSTLTGYWGPTPSMIVKGGGGNAYARFNLSLPTAGLYSIDAWWTGASNRSTKTPFVVFHKSGSDTVKINQSLNTLKWNRIGTFNFSGNASDVVIISNNVDTTTYICADAIRITSSDSTISTASNPRYIAEEFNLVQNYPNPFNPATRIRYLLAGRMPAAVSLKVFDVLGTSIVTLVDEEQAAGTYETIFDAAALPSGVYFCELRAGGLKQVKKMLLLR